MLLGVSGEHMLYVLERYSPISTLCNGLDTANEGRNHTDFLFPR